MDTSPNPPLKPGRPRSEAARHAILRATLDLVSEKGFRAISMDQIAAGAGVGKMTVYRRWPNKAALVMDALLQLIGPETAFPAAERALHRLRAQLELQARFFLGPSGTLVRSLLAEAQSDEELAQAFLARWIAPRRAGVIAILRQAVVEGDLRPEIDLEVATDQLYGPIYYRLLIGSGVIDGAFLEALYRQFLQGHASVVGSHKIGR
ncbi:transcriptional regulator, TetR family [Granulicella rosea]|uniref:Transcriptional regulator, TetR family n=1 Tax=Granulicella rosea TaxID=474952 RepID=A0A239LTZ5_9BACT|nr:TetR/AcrR family transcriptional regulator [Granulicella rosea]SNT33348.1 transcriptional regulator, TetR family [Granulicella rosea]